MTTAVERIGDYLGDYLETFTEFEEVAPGRNLPWLRRLRENAFALFSQAGFPTTHDEDWRFTNVAAIARTPFQLAGGGNLRLSNGELSGQELSDPELSNLARNQLEGAAARLVFVDGRFRRELSSFGLLPDGVVAAGLREQIEEHPEQIEAHLGAYLEIECEAFCALNTAFIQDGAYVRIPRGRVVEGPICLLFLSTAGEAPAMTHPRNLIVVEDEGQATILEEYASLGGDTPALTNAVTELVAGEGAVVSHFMVEREHREAFKISTLRIEQGRSANVTSHALLLGGGLVRNNIHPVLAGNGAECMLNGLFIGSRAQHLDNFMHVEHVRPHGRSRQFYNGLLAGHAHGVFHGRIVVHRDAQKTDAKQTNRNLLLSDDAQIDTKPQLEIYADDVKCTHGASIGQIEEGALFYLRSRGIDEASARKLLLMAFAGECLGRMKAGAVRDYVESMIRRRVREMMRTAAPTPPAESGDAVLGEETGRGDDEAGSWEEVG